MRFPHVGATHMPTRIVSSGATRDACLESPYSRRVRFSTAVYGVGLLMNFSPLLYILLLLIPIVNPLSIIQKSRLFDSILIL